MPQVTALAQRIGHHRARAQHFSALAKRRHFRAAVLGRRALRAGVAGRRFLARKLLRRALVLKAAAARATLRAQWNRGRIAAMRRARSLRRRHR